MWLIDHIGIGIDVQTAVGSLGYVVFISFFESCLIVDMRYIHILLPLVVVGCLKREGNITVYSAQLYFTIYLFISE